MNLPEGSASTASVGVVNASTVTARPVVLACAAACCIRSWSRAVIPKPLGTGFSARSEAVVRAGGSAEPLALSTCEVAGTDAYAGASPTALTPSTTSTARDLRPWWCAAPARCLFIILLSSIAAAIRQTEHRCPSEGSATSQLLRGQRNVVADQHMLRCVRINRKVRRYAYAASRMRPLIASWHPQDQDSGSRGGPLEADSTSKLRPDTQPEIGSAARQRFGHHRPRRHGTGVEPRLCSGGSVPGRAADQVGTCLGGHVALPNPGEAAHLASPQAAVAHGNRNGPRHGDQYLRSPPVAPSRDGSNTPVPPGGSTAGLAQRLRELPNCRHGDDPSADRGTHRRHQRSAPHCAPVGGTAGVHPRHARIRTVRKRLRRRLGHQAPTRGTPVLCPDDPADCRVPYPDTAGVDERLRRPAGLCRRAPARRQQHGGRDRGPGPVAVERCRGVGNDGPGGELFRGRRWRRLHGHEPQGVGLLAGGRQFGRLHLVVPDLPTERPRGSGADAVAGLRLAVRRRTDLLHEQPGLGRRRRLLAG